MSEMKKDGYKMIQYDETPSFDQSAQYIEQGDISDHDTYIKVGYVVKDLSVDDEVENIENSIEHVEQEPWSDPSEKQKDAEIKLLKEKILSQERTMEDLMFNVLPTIIGGGF